MGITFITSSMEGQRPLVLDEWYYTRKKKERQINKCDDDDDDDDKLRFILVKLYKKRISQWQSGVI